MGYGNPRNMLPCWTRLDLSALPTFLRAQENTLGCCGFLCHLRSLEQYLASYVLLNYCENRQANSPILSFPSLTTAARPP